MTKHVHADLMKLYAEDAMETDKPWLRWEFYAHEKWITFEHGGPSWVVGSCYRRKPNNVIVNGFEVIDDVIKEEASSFQCFVEEPSNLSFNSRSRGHATHTERSRGIVHTTQAGAIAHCKARLGIDPNEY